MAHNPLEISKQAHHGPVFAIESKKKRQVKYETIQDNL